jgi:preprotein translocase subunit SecB
MANNMSLSPLQMKQLLFTKIKVEAYDYPEETETPWAPTFDFDGVTINTEVMTATQEGQEEDPRNFLVMVKISIPNAPNTQKNSPYTVEIHAQAWFEISSDFEKEKRESIIAVNGSSMIVGAIREMLTQLTARSLFGPLTLPSLRFHPDTK